MLSSDAVPLVGRKNPLLSYGKGSCLEDYSPCSCNDRPSYGLEIICDSIDAQVVRDVLGRTNTNDLFTLQLTVPPPSSDNIVTIPADLLNGKRAGNIVLTCPVSSWILSIDADAFRSSSDFTFFFFTAGCDLNQLDFASFLNNFNSLTTIFISQSANVQGIQNLPALPSLNQLAVTFTNGLEKIADFSRLGKVALKRLLLNGNQLGDLTVDKILNSLASSPSSAMTLQTLWLTGNLLTRIPSSLLSSFTQLIELDLSNNTFSILASGSFIFRTPVDYLYLESDSINSIEPGAFQGILSLCLIFKSNN